LHCQISGCIIVGDRTLRRQMNITCPECGFEISNGNWNCPNCEEYYDFIISLRNNIRRSDEQTSQTERNGTPPQEVQIKRRD
jgi:uncharacterized Zn finger protein (UPF0148 family)